MELPLFGFSVSAVPVQSLWGSTGLVHATRSCPHSFTGLRPIPALWISNGTTTDLWVVGQHEPTTDLCRALT